MSKMRKNQDPNEVFIKMIYSIDKIKQLLLVIFNGYGVQKVKAKENKLS